MKLFRSLPLWAALILMAALTLPAPPSWAVNTTLTGTSITKYETPSTTTFAIQCPSLAAAGADTAIATLDLRSVPSGYPGSSGVPTWRIIAQAMSTGADTVRVEMWTGPKTDTRVRLTSMSLNSTSRLIDKVAIATDLTLYPFGYLKVKVVNKHASVAKSPLVYITLPHTITMTMNRGL